MKAWPAALLLGALFSAQPGLADEAYDSCITASDGTNAAYGECGAALVAREDRKLNEAWKALFAGADGQTRTDLLAEQRLWVKYSQAACAFYANGEQGREGQVLSYPACQAEVLAKRTEMLESYREALAPR